MKQEDEMKEHDKWKCSERRCGWIGTSAEYLVAADPFNEGCELVACPNCREVNTLTACCDVDGCTKDGSCGTPTKDGYRFTCSEHKPERS